MFTNCCDKPSVCGAFVRNRLHNNSIHANSFQKLAKSCSGGALPSHQTRIAKVGVVQGRRRISLAVSEPTVMTIMPSVDELQKPITLSHSGHDVLTSAGAPVLLGLAKQITVQAAADGASLILGASSVDAQTSMLDVSLGKLVARRFVALGRTSLWWMCPVWGTSAADIPEETQFMLTELQDGTYAALLPLLDSGRFRATLQPMAGTPSSSKDLGLRVESGASDVTSVTFSSALYITAGLDPYAVISQGVAAAAALSGPAKPRASKAVPPSLDVFGWCTWDAFYSRVSASGLMDGLGSLRTGGVPPRLLIVDDGWQQTDVDIEYRGNVCLPETETERQLEEAVADFLGGPGDQAPDSLKAEHRMMHEEEKDTKAVGSKKRKRSEATWVVTAMGSVTTKISGMFSKFEKLMLDLGKRLLDSSRSDSWVIRSFTALANGPLRATLLRFYAHASDHTRRLTSIEANGKFAGPHSGPEAPLSSSGGDLRAVIAAIKATHGVEYLYIWHAMGAFWGGLGLSDPGVSKYDPKLLLPVPTPGVLSVDPAVSWVQPVLAGVSLPLEPSELHHDMHAYLSSCGVDGVKVDVQGTIGLAGSAVGAGGGPALAGRYHASLEASVRRHFPGNHLINCMCHSTEDLYRMEDSNLARVSDDFYPLRPASHTTHIANCAFNSIFMGEVVIPDWDMFHSKHPAAHLHAAARAISGGPVYVSDRPGHHDFELLRRLVFPDGSVLRAHLPGRPTADCLFADVCRDGKTALKIWNSNAVNGVVGVFNVQGSTYSRQHRSFYTHDAYPAVLRAVVRPDDVANLAWNEIPGANGACLLYSDQSQRKKIVQADDFDDGLEVAVVPNGGAGGCDVVTISPVMEVDGIAFAAIGLTDMLNAGGAVMDVQMAAHGPAGSLVVATLDVRGVGQFLAYASKKPVTVDINGILVEFEYEKSAAELRFHLGGDGSGGVLTLATVTVRF